ncbi:hypothetical protein KP509_24G081000 [Ceratopteris richardii]|uniref:Uncharacterized protein n=1 Tax=Ceratopteris richardii TaxID=49495 RepID=A0A8T2RZD9_CERRI|nr:hypothetical protein KP509_24G081000 [Ceratopteris richardii]
MDLVGSRNRSIIAALLLVLLVMFFVTMEVIIQPAEAGCSNQVGTCKGAFGSRNCNGYCQSCHYSPSSPTSCTKCAKGDCTGGIGGFFGTCTCYRPCRACTSG